VFWHQIRRKKKKKREKKKKRKKYVMFRWKARISVIIKLSRLSGEPPYHTMCFPSKTFQYLLGSPQQIALDLESIFLLVKMVGGGSA
jgi:hypothetical protein